MVRDCKGCGKPFETEGKAKFCADEGCRRARDRARKRTPAVVVPLPSPVPQSPLGALHSNPGLYGATVSALTSANRIDTPAGQLALVLADRLSAATADTGSSLAALAKQHLAVLAEALRDAPRAADVVDDLRSRREARLGRHA